MVLEHLSVVLPSSLTSRQAHHERLLELERDSQKLLDAFYADAIDTHELKREQARIASQCAVAQTEVNKLELNEQIITRHLDNCLRLLSSAEQHYLQSDDLGRRELNQGVFEHLYVDDDEIVASDLKPAFRRLMSESLGTDLKSERKREQTKQNETESLWLVSDAGNKSTSGHKDAHRDLPTRARRTAPDDRLGAYLGLERPRGRLPWERKNHGP